MKTAKKVFSVLFCLVVLTALLGGITLLRAVSDLKTAYDRAAAAEIVNSPAVNWPTVKVDGAPLQPWQVFHSCEPAADLPQNVFYRWAAELAPQYLHWQAAAQRETPETDPALQAADLAWELTVPAGWAAALTVTDQSGNAVYDGAVNESYTRTFTAEGADTCALQLTRTQGDDTLALDYCWSVALDVEVTVSLSADTVGQGGVVGVLVDGNVFGDAMTISTELGLCDFVPLDAAGSYGAYVPVAYNRGAGDWPITVTVGDAVHELSVAVQETEFTVQYMTIDQGVADATMNSAAASREYREAIYPLYELTDNEKYWDGPFIEPVTGYRLTTQFGLWRYTNGVYSERHGGIDMACPAGTPIAAPAGGKVLLAEYLQMTGYTVVIAHGGGVKSMFYHMNSLDVAEGDVVAAADVIGTVGSTGYSTGPHLHYEVKIGSQSIDPFALFDGTSGLFAGQSVEE